MGLPYVRDAGTGPSVVLLHAGASNSRQWHSLMERLAGRFRVLACDMSGCGKSPALPSELRYTLDEEVSFLSPVFETAGDDFHLIGHSYGGAVALKAALRHGARLRSLTLFEPVLFSLLIATAPESDAAREILGLAERTTRLAQRGDLEGAAREFVDYWFQAGMWDSMREEARPAIRASMDRAGRCWDALLHDPVRFSDFLRVEAPTLFLVAQNSTLAARALSELLIRALSNARAVHIRGVGHMAPLTNAEQVNPLIESFLLAQRG